MSYHERARLFRRILQRGVLEGVLRPNVSQDFKDRRVCKGERSMQRIKPSIPWRFSTGNLGTMASCVLLFKVAFLIAMTIL